MLLFSRASDIGATAVDVACGNGAHAEDGAIGYGDSVSDLCSRAYVAVVSDGNAAAYYCAGSDECVCSDMYIVLDNRTGVDY